MGKYDRELRTNAPNSSRTYFPHGRLVVPNWLVYPFAGELVRVRWGGDLRQRKGTIAKHILGYHSRALHCACPTIAGAPMSRLLYAFNVPPRSYYRHEHHRCFFFCDVHQSVRPVVATLASTWSWSAPLHCRFDYRPPLTSLLRHLIERSCRNHSSNGRSTPGDDLSVPFTGWAPVSGNPRPAERRRVLNISPTDSNRFLSVVPGRDRGSTCQLRTVVAYFSMVWERLTAKGQYVPVIPTARAAVHQRSCCCTALSHRRTSQPPASVVNAHHTKPREHYRNNASLITFITLCRKKLRESSFPAAFLISSRSARLDSAEAPLASANAKSPDTRNFFKASFCSSLPFSPIRQ